MRKYVVIFLGILQIQLLQAQSFPDFKNESDFYKDNRQTRGIFAAGFLDVNGDLIDDLVSLHKGFEYHISLGNASNKPLFPGQSFQFNHYFDAFGLAVSDLNGDIIPDFVTGGSFGYLHVLLSNQQGGFSPVLLPADFLVQTINIADVNQDRFPDIYVSNDNGPNTVFLNNGIGQFTENTTLIDFTTIPVSDGSGNYGSVWVDVNLDNKPDLAIAKCKAGVSNPLDPRRINRLFIQQADGSFEDEAEKYNFALGEQSWAVTFGDLDNDGDMDAFVVNHYDPHVLLENKDGQTFTAIPIGQTPVSSFAFQALMRDFDNDGWLDIALSGLEGLSFLHNKQNMQFEYINSFSTPLPGMSVTAGDINDDGRIDLHTTLHEPLNFPGKADDRLYINQDKSNHYFKCNLLPGSESKSAIGSKIELFGPWGVQTRQVSSGESFGVTNSTQQHFGMGQHLVADSIRVTWPAGHTDIFRNLEGDQTWLIQENLCASPVVDHFPETIILDTITGVLLDAPEGFISYKWNDGTLSKTNTVYIEAQYFVRMADTTGCLHYSKPVYIERGCFRENTDVLAEADTRVVCAGDSLILHAIPAKQYAWSTGDTIPELVVRQNGLYKVSATDYCGRMKEDSVFVRFDWVQPPVITFPDTVPAGSAVTLVSSDENTVWMHANTFEIIGSGSSFSVTVTENDTSFLAAAFRNPESKSQSTGLRTFPAANQYGSNSINGGLVFNVTKDAVLRHVSVFTDTPGKRKLVIYDDKGQTVYEKEFFIRFGTNRLEIQADLVPGNNYILTTDMSVNMAESGFAGPRLLRHFNDQAIRFPYEVDDVLTITESTSGLNYYYYFYYWDVSYDVQTCFSSPVLIPIVSATSTSIKPPAPGNWELKVYPNPANDEIHMPVPDFARHAIIEIVSSLGEVIYSTKVVSGHVTIDTRDWRPGFYRIKVNINGGTQHVKLVKI